MTGITLQTAQEALERWLAADRELAEKGQSITYEGRTLSRAHVSEVRTNITYWQGIVASLTPRQGPRFRQVVPR